MIRNFISMAFGVVLLAGQSVFAADCKCPVSGKAASKDNKVAYKGREVYFCCGNCPKAFEKDIKKFAAKANHQLMVTKQLTQIACPFAGKPVNKETEIDVDGVKVSFCCNNCKGKAQKAEDIVALVFASLDKGFTTQTVCPVSGKAIDITKTTEYKGKTVYFCCENCPKAFDAEKHAAKLPQLKDE